MDGSDQVCPCRKRAWKRPPAHLGCLVVMPARWCYLDPLPCHACGKFRFFSPFLFLFPEHLMLMLLPTGCVLPLSTLWISITPISRSLCYLLAELTDSSGKWSGAWHAKSCVGSKFQYCQCRGMASGWITIIEDHERKSFVSYRSRAMAAALYLRQLSLARRTKS